MSIYPCKYCNKKFSIKYSFEIHIRFCAFMHKPKSEKQREMEYSIPSLMDSQSNELLSNIMYRLEKLETDNKKLKD